MVHHACSLNYRAALVKHCEVRDPTDIESSRQLGIALGIYLDDDGTASHVCGRPLYLGRRQAAGTAPFCPEIRKHWNPGVLHDFIELIGINFQGFIRRRNGGFAHAAPAGIGKVSSWYAVLTITCPARPNNAHTHLLMAEPGRDGVRCN